MNQYRIYYKKDGTNFSKLVNAKSLHEVYEKYNDVDLVKIVFIKSVQEEIDLTDLDDDEED